MDTNFILWALAIYILVILAGATFIGLNHVLKLQRMKDLQTFLSTEMTGRLRNAIMDLMISGMDIIPEKLLDAKKELDREEDSWTR